MASLYRSLARLTGAGVPPIQIASVLEAEAPRDVRPLASTLAEALRTGTPLSSAVRRVRGLVPVHHAQVLLAAERSGTLERALDGLAASCEAEARVKARAWDALRRPAILFAALSLLGPVPLLASSGVLAYLGVSMPMLAVLVGAFVGAGALLTSARAGGSRVGAFLESVPGVSDLVVRAAAARACRTVAVLNAAGLSLVTTLESAAQTAGAGVVGRGFRRAARDVEKGGRLAETLKREGALSGAAAALAAEGEATGRLDSAFERAGKLLDDDVHDALTWRIRIAGAVLYVGMGVVIGWRVVTGFPRP
jgi:type IV pilus assembly protein PilC